MPIYEFLCTSCGQVSEHLVLGEREVIRCSACGAHEMKRILSVSSSASGTKESGRFPGPGDTACCGSSPSAGGCIPGSCCGKAGNP